MLYTFYFSTPAANIDLTFDLYFYTCSKYWPHLWLIFLHLQQISTWLMVSQLDWALANPSSLQYQLCAQFTAPYAEHHAPEWLPLGHQLLGQQSLGHWLVPLLVLYEIHYITCIRACKFIMGCVCVFACNKIVSSYSKLMKCHTINIHCTQPLLCLLTPSLYLSFTAEILSWIS